MHHEVGKPADHEFDLALMQGAKEHIGCSDRQGERHAWVLGNQAIEDCRNDRRHRWRRADPQLSNGWVGKRSDLVDTLLDFIEDHFATLDKHFAVNGWCDTL